MRLKITTAPDPGSVSGASTQVWLEDVDVSRYVKRVELAVDADKAVSVATVTFYLTDTDIDVAAMVAGSVVKYGEAALLNGR